MPAYETPHVVTTRVTDPHVLARRHKELGAIFDTFDVFSVGSVAQANLSVLGKAMGRRVGQKKYLGWSPMMSKEVLNELREDQDPVRRGEFVELFERRMALLSEDGFLYAMNQFQSIATEFRTKVEMAEEETLRSAEQKSIHVHAREMLGPFHRALGRVLHSRASQTLVERVRGGFGGAAENRGNSAAFNFGMALSEVWRAMREKDARGRQDLLGALDAADTVYILDLLEYICEAVLADTTITAEDFFRYHGYLTIVKHPRRDEQWWGNRRFGDAMDRRFWAGQPWPKVARQPGDDTKGTYHSHHGRYNETVRELPKEALSLSLLTRDLADRQARIRQLEGRLNVAQGGKSEWSSPPYDPTRILRTVKGKDAAMKRRQRQKEMQLQEDLRKNFLGEEDTKAISWRQLVADHEHQDWNLHNQTSGLELRRQRKLHEQHEKWQIVAERDKLRQDRLLQQLIQIGKVSSEEETRQSVAPENIARATVSGFRSKARTVGLGHHHKTNAKETVDEGNKSPLGAEERRLTLELEEIDRRLSSPLATKKTPARAGKLMLRAKKNAQAEKRQAGAGSTVANKAHFSAAVGDGNVNRLWEKFSDAIHQKQSFMQFREHLRELDICNDPDGAAMFDGGLILEDGCIGYEDVKKLIRTSLEMTAEDITDQEIVGICKGLDYDDDGNVSIDNLLGFVVYGSSATFLREDGDFVEVGDTVVWAGDDDDVPLHTVGKVISVCPERKRARVKANNKVFVFMLEDLVDTTQVSYGLFVGDRVCWYTSDEDIPPQAVGLVTGFVDGQVRVAFQTAYWCMDADELLLSEKALTGITVEFEQQKSVKQLGEAKILEEPKVVVTNVTIQGMIYDQVMQLPTLVKSLKNSIKSSVVREIGHGIKEEEVLVDLSKGSVVAKVTIFPPIGVHVGSVVTSLVTSATFTKSLVGAISHVPGVGKVTRGTLSVAYSVTTVDRSEVATPPESDADEVQAAAVELAPETAKLAKERRTTPVRKATEQSAKAEAEDLRIKPKPSSGRTPPPRKEPSKTASEVAVGPRKEKPAAAPGARTPRASNATPEAPKEKAPAVPGQTVPLASNATAKAEGPVVAAAASNDKAVVSSVQDVIKHQPSEDKENAVGSNPEERKKKESIVGKSISVAPAKVQDNGENDTSLHIDHFLEEEAEPKPTSEANPSKAEGESAQKTEAKDEANTAQKVESTAEPSTTEEKEASTVQKAESEAAEGKKLKKHHSHGHKDKKDEDKKHKKHHK